jgi:hypothetical protein
MTEYLIFARKEYEQPLELLGRLRLEGAADEGETRLANQARGQFGSEDWIEMIAVPEIVIAQVLPVSEP